MIVPSPFTPTEPDWTAAAAADKAVGFRFSASHPREVSAAYHRAAAATGKEYDDPRPGQGTGVMLLKHKACRLPCFVGNKQFGSVVRTGMSKKFDVAIDDDCEPQIVYKPDPINFRRAALYWYAAVYSRKVEYRAVVWLSDRFHPTDPLPWIISFSQVVGAVHCGHMPMRGSVSPYYVNFNAHDDVRPSWVDLAQVCGYVPYELAERLATGDLNAWADAAYDPNVTTQNARKRAKNICAHLTERARYKLSQM